MSETTQATSVQRTSTFSRARSFALSAAVGTSALLALLLSWFFASSPLSGVEPNAEYIDCGPALLDRPSPLPHPACADAYGLVVFLSLLFGAVGIVGLLACAATIGARRYHFASER